VHDERHFVESYSLRQTWEVDLHPEEGCEGPVDLYLSLVVDPRSCSVRGRRDWPAPTTRSPRTATYFPPTSPGRCRRCERPNLLELATELAGVGGPICRWKSAATDSFPSATDAPERTLRIVAHQQVSLVRIRSGEEVPCEMLDRCLGVSRFLLNCAPEMLS